MRGAVGVRRVFRVYEIAQLIFAPPPELCSCLRPFTLLFAHHRRHRRRRGGSGRLDVVISCVRVEAAPLVEGGCVHTRVVHPWRRSLSNCKKNKNDKQKSGRRRRLVAGVLLVECLASAVSLSLSLSLASLASLPLTLSLYGIPGSPITDGNKLWWQQQFRPVNTATLSKHDVLLIATQHLQSELLPDMPCPPLDQLLSEYVKMHAEVVSQKTPESKDKVIIVSPNAQMANRFRITVFALIVGLLLDKAVHVHFSSGWHAQLDDIIVPAGRNSLKSAL